MDGTNKFFETERCNIRLFEEKDLNTLIEYRNNDDWMKYQGFKNLSKDEYRHKLLVPFDLQKGSQLAVVNRDNDYLIGDLYLKKYETTIDIGYTIHPKYSRQGFTFEYVSTLVEYLTQNYPECTIRAEMDLENVASKNLLIKLGFSMLSESKDGYVYTYQRL